MVRGCVCLVSGVLCAYVTEHCYGYRCALANVESL